MDGVSPAPKQGPQKHSRRIAPAESSFSVAPGAQQRKRRRLAAGVAAQRESAVADALPVEDVCGLAEVVVRAARTARDDALVGVEPVRMDFCR